MQDVQQAMKVAMELKGFAPSTQRMYLAHITRYADFCGKHPAATGYDEVRSFLHHAIAIKKLSASYINSAYSALKFYFQTVQCRDWNMLHIPRVKKKYTLPVVLTEKEVRQIIDVTPNLKHKAILSTIYSSGLRVSEMAHLKISDIHSHSMRIFVRQAKGNQDRYTLLSAKNLRLLRDYWKVYRPSTWLFPGVPDTKPMASRSIQTMFQVSLRAAGIAKRATLHTLRHSFATHLLNHGASILQIKELMGHADIQTTSMYLHLTDAQVLGLKSPLDLPQDQKDSDDHA
jgi:integrase/recombinase XerD